MAAFYVNRSDSFVAADGSFDLEDLFTNYPAFVDGDSIYLNANEGVTMNVTVTPSKLPSSINIRSGAEMFLDGANAVNPIHFRTSGLNSISIEAGGLLNSSLGWYTIGTSTGASNWNLDASAYWTSGGRYCDSKGHFTGLWVETARRVNYTSGIGELPVVDDWVYKSSDPRNSLGRIIHVSDNGDGTGYFVVKFLTWSAANADAIEVRKIVDNEGPSFERTWTGLVNGVDVLAQVSDGVAEDDLFQEFTNCAQFSLTNPLLSHGKGLFGFVFQHEFLSNTIIFGDGVNGNIVPSGARVRVPKISFGTASTASLTTNDSLNMGTYTGRVNGNDVGNLTLKGVLCSDFNLFYYAYKKVQIEYCAMVYYLGSIVSVPSYMKHCISSPRVTQTTNSPGSLRPSGPMSAYDCSVMQKANVSGVDLTRTGDCEIVRCHITHAYAANYEGMRGGFGYPNVTIDNCVVITPRMILYNTVGSNWVIKRLKYGNAINGIDDSLNAYAMQPSNSHQLSVPLQILGLEEVGVGQRVATLCVINLVSIQGANIRAIGLVDEPFQYADVTSKFINISYDSGRLSVARCYAANNYGTDAYPYRAPIIEGIATLGNLEVVDVGTNSYNSRLSVLSSDSRVKGFRVGEEESFGTYRQWRHTWGNVPIGGAHFYDVYYNSTKGAVIFTSSPPSAATDGILCRYSSGVVFDEDFFVVLSDIGDYIELEMDYFTRGHSALTGVVATVAEAANQYTVFTTPFDGLSGKADVEFQYDIGAGWNGSWLNARTASNLTSITIPATGVKLKIKVTATVAKTFVYAVAFQTDSTEAFRLTNRYAIDQSSINLTFDVKDQAGLPVSGAFVYIDDDDSAPTIFQSATDGNGQATLAYVGSAVPNSKWRVRKYGYRPFTALVNIAASDITLPITLITDPQQV